MYCVYSQETFFLVIHIIPSTHTHVQCVFDGRIYSLRVECGSNYPNVVPKVWFVTRVNLQGVNSSTGEVNTNIVEL